MHAVHAPLSRFNPDLPAVPVRADRRKLAGRHWRAAADDGEEFGFDLEAPLADGDVVWQTERCRYVLCQEPEPLLEVPLEGGPDAAALLGWAVGNLHLPLEAQPRRILAPDEPGLQAALERLGLGYRRLREVFRPHRLAGPAHGHGHDSHHGHSH